MTTTLNRFSGPYATITVATYEPLILRWISMWGLGTIATDLATRSPRAASIQSSPLPTAVALSGMSRSPSARLPVQAPVVAGPHLPMDADGSTIPAGDVSNIVDGSVPDAVRIGAAAYARGVVRKVESRVRARALFSRMIGAWPATRAAQRLAVRTVPVVSNPALGLLPANFDLATARAGILNEMTAAVDTALAIEGDSLNLDLGEAVKNSAYGFFPGKVEEALSPVGLAHFYRQIFFNLEEGVGPLEQAFTIAPLETFEVAYVATRTQVHEETIELASESISETGTEEKNVDEVSDKVSSMVQRDASAAMSASASGTIGVWQASGEASADFANSSQNSREQTTRRLKEVTTRASERLTKSFTLKTRDVDEFTTTNTTRRVIHNESNAPVSYGLRRVLRKVRVKVQDLGPQLVWQIYVCEPGAGLAQSDFVHFRTPSDIPVPDVPPMPQGGTDTGSTSATIEKVGSKDVVALVIPAGPSRKVTAVVIDSVTDLEGGGSSDDAPSPINNDYFDAAQDPLTGTYTVKIAVRRGDSENISVNYTYTWLPSDAAIEAWQVEAAAYRAQINEERLQAKFERERETITEMRRIRQRPAADLRREERYEVMNRMISQLFARADNPSEPTPLEIEYFHRYFDLEAMFTWMHPSWWRPRYAARSVGLTRPSYTITADAEPAPMGSSLAWAIQLDGDSRRNEFINSPWVRACLPIRPGRERAALAWLAKHVEGERGYNPNGEPLRTLLEAMDNRRAAERAVSDEGPDWVTIDSNVTELDEGTGTVGGGATAAKPEGIYPLISEFDVVVPTDGFVYERLEIDGGA